MDDDIYKTLQNTAPAPPAPSPKISDMLSNKKFNRIVTELFLRCRKLNISIVFITQSDFAVPKRVRLNSTHYFTMKITNKEERQQIASHDSSDIGF